jgi:hypothetical protein
MPDEPVLPAPHGRRLSRAAGLTVLAGTAVLGFALGWLVAPCRSGCSAEWAWLGGFVRSPGFGGVAAVIAALIAFLAARQSAREAGRQEEQNRQQRTRADRKAQWWARAQWALDLTVSGDTDKATIGHRVLSSLAESEWADEHEADVIAAATIEALEAVPGSAAEGRSAVTRTGPSTRVPAADGYRSASSGRFVSPAERGAAARARVTADGKRGVGTAPWIVELAKQG